ncbi:bacillithiol system redox-active protein YtxJ [Sporosarcina sp. NCCP-2716]|uniref:bacillithiol system redox-active protein YtxJ n=1 Tax=Sporosarcina sp. NCCP-2716 TaxID=2943679 RepID=UPI002041999A|nr:bacillithiol system redox-active protein YtxJ [Sporosarcina sp. NCCP-2716]
MNELHTLQQWQDALQESDGHPLFVMKHSSTCPISAAGYQEFLFYETELPKYVAVVQTARDVSQKIAEDTGVRHESPQVLLLKDGKAVWHASHYDIQRDNLAGAEERSS